MTVGDITNAQGDTQRHGFQGTTGGLSDKMFSLMFQTGTTNNYTITAIVVGATTATSEQLYFVTASGLTDTEEESLALHVDGESDPFVWSDSTEVIPGSYRWPARTDLDWSSETTVTLRLREFPRPTVTNVEVTSTPALETDTYGADETIEVSVTFSEAVNATSDTDFVLSVAGAKRAPLLRGSGTATLVFGYTVVSSDDDDNGIWIGDETRTLVGNRGGVPQAGTITSVATGAAANLDHTELSTLSDHKVDGSRTTENVAPSFSSSATISVTENQTTVVTVLATDSDADDSVTGYALTGGADQGFFSIVATSGALTFDAAPNYEDAEDQGNNNTYVVEVTATSGTGTRVMTADQTITVTVTDVAEQSAKPAKPMLAKVTGSTTSLTATWEAPGKNGGPAITGYKLEYRAAPAGTWMDFAHTGTGVTATITGLTADTSYQARVLAENGETDSDWSDASDAVSTNAAAALPTLSIGNASATEGDVMRFDFTLSAAASEDVTVIWTASIESEDTASASDLPTTTTGLVTVTAGQTTGSLFLFTAAEDTLDEDDETFTVTLSNPLPVGIVTLAADPTAKGTIENDDDCAQATTTTCEVDVGSSVTGSIAQKFDFDWFKVVLEADTRYQIDLEGEDTGRGTLPDPWLPGIADADGSSISTVANQDGGVGVNARTIFTPTTGGIHYVVARTPLTASVDTGTYTLSVIVLGANGNSEADTDFPNNNTTTGRVEVGASATGNIESGTDVDRFKVDLVAGKTYQFDLEGAPTGRGTLEDPYLSLADPMGTVLESDNDDGDGVNSQIVYTATETDTHYLRADKSATETGTYTLSVRDVTPVSDNAAPVFTSSPTFDVEENQTTVGTVLAADSDTDDSITGYAITGGADQTFFSIGATSGALTFDAAPNYEDAEDQGNNNTYVVVVQATSGTETREMTATQTITVTVTDMSGEAPGKPAKPRVSAASAASLRVNWSAPSNAGPAITDYDVRYRAGTSGSWSDASHTGTAKATTLTGLTEDTSYQVQVRATNAEGTGAWSDSGSGTPAEEDDLPADTSTTGRVEVGGAAVGGDILEPVKETVTWTVPDPDDEGNPLEVTGTVYDFDTDWFAVELEEGRTYRIDMKGAILADDDDLTLSLPQINAIYNKYGDYLVNTFDSDESDPPLPVPGDVSCL